MPENGLNSDGMSVRFAPSPTGRFHIGNLRTAWISHLFARELGLRWIVRFEDIDRPRVIAGAQEVQLEDMRKLGLVPDEVAVQSLRHSLHEALFRKAVETGKVYPCYCSRKEILQNLEELASAPHQEAPIYNGCCRGPKNRAPSEHPTIAWRFLNPEDEQGWQDFIIARTDADESGFVPSYHWACAIDDHEGDHKLLVRASDLAHVISQQRLVHQWVGKITGKLRPYPAVFHTALIVSDDRHRLEKRTRGVTLPELMENGTSAQSLLRVFENSLNKKLIEEFNSGKLWGETPEEMTLSELFA